MIDPIKIAYLEDDADQGDAVAKWLTSDTMQCSVYATVEAMQLALESTAFDVIILDVDLHGESSGMTMLDHIRRTLGDAIPILMVSAKSYWQAALSSGANDFLEKPLKAKTVLIHVHRLLRPLSQHAAIENYPPYKLNASQQEITLEGSPVDLSADEYALASTLFRHVGKVLSYGQLTDSLSNRSANESIRTVEKDLIRLKRKMNFHNIDGWRLEPVYRHGYRLVNAEYDSVKTG